jgi:COMPASS component SWD3
MSAASQWGKNVKKDAAQARTTRVNKLAGAEPEPESADGCPSKEFSARAKGGCFSVQYNYDGTMLAAGFNDGNCFAFDTATGKSKSFGGAYERGRTPVTALRFRPKNFTVGGEVADRILKETFDAIDTDGGGTLDKEEIMDAAWILKGDIGADDMTEEQFSIIINQLDEDGDGEVDMEEFAHWWRQSVQTTEPDDPIYKALMAANIRTRDGIGAVEVAKKAHASSLREKLPDRENLRDTVIKNRETLQKAVASAEAAAAEEQASASSIGEDWKGMLTVGCCHGVIQHWDCAKHKLLHSAQETSGDGVNQIYALEFSHDGSIIVTGGHDYKVRLYDEETKRLFQVFESGLQNDGRPGHSNRVYSVRFHPTEKNQLISGGWSDTIQLWDIRAKSTIKKISGPHISGDALDICGNYVLMGAAKSVDQLQIYDLRTFKPVKNLDWEGGVPSADEPCMIYSACFCHASEGRLCVAGGTVSDKVGQKPSPTVKVFNTETGSVALAAALGAVSSVHFSPDGSKLAAGAGDGVIKQFDTRSLLSSL